MYITLFLSAGSSLWSQSPDFYLGMDQIFDNREYYSAYTVPGTIFGARINPGVSFSLDSLQSIAAGINYMYEFGGELLGVRPQLDLYYHFSGKGFRIFLGSFPRRELPVYPLLLLTDTLAYYRPNMEGGAFGYTGANGHIYTWIDWTGRISDERRESFLLGLDARYRNGIVFIEPYLLMYHHARTSASSDENAIQDNGGGTLLAGVDISGMVPLDRCLLATGVASSYNRIRPANFDWSIGWHSTLELSYSVVGFKGVYYRGDPFYLVYGDPFYQSGNYGRMDFYIEPFRTQKVTSKFSWNLHFSGGEGLFHSQQILVTVLL